MHLGNLGQQFVLKSKKAFDLISFIGYENASFNEWYSRKENRDKAARRDYFDTEKNKRLRGDIYITQIIDEEMNGNDARLR